MLPASQILPRKFRHGDEVATVCHYEKQFHANAITNGASLAEPMYLRLNACIGLAAERPRFPLACLSGDSGQAESWNTNALLNRWHVNPVSFSASTYSATVVQRGRRFCSIYNYAAYN